MGFMGGIFMLFWGAILIGAIVLVVVLLARNLQNTHQKTQQPYGQARDVQGGSSALDILAERFARGEINEDEYTKMKSTIQSR